MTYLKAQGFQLCGEVIGGGVIPDAIKHIAAKLLEAALRGCGETDSPHILSPYRYNSLHPIFPHQPGCGFRLERIIGAEPEHVVSWDSQGGGSAGLTD